MLHSMKKQAAKFLPILLSLIACNQAPQPAHIAIGSTSTSNEQTQPHANLTTNAPFDYYLLNLSWSPEFCHSHADAPECAQHSTFVLHGLWPQTNNPTEQTSSTRRNNHHAPAKYLENCSNAPGPRDPSQFKDLYPDQGLLEHEWRTHGTCSGLSPNDYFNAARTAFHSVAIPPTLAQLDHQISLPPDEILGLFTAANPHIPATSLALSCGNNYLTAVEVCLDKSLNPTPCGPIRSCRANTVRIPPP